MNIKNIITLIILCKTSLSLSTQEPYEVYVENYYGSPITCVVNNTKNIPVQNGIPVRIFSSQTKQKLASLFIQSTNYLSAPTSLENYLQQISEGIKQNQGKNPVLVIKPSDSLGDYFSDWNIKLIWYNRNIVVKSFSMEMPEDEDQTKERQFQTKKISTQDFLSLIEQGNLYGSECASKIEQLRNINYTAIQKKNSNNLQIYALLHSFGYSRLQLSIEAIQANYQYYLERPDAGHTQNGNRDPHEVKILVQELIHTQYEKLLTYKANGWLDEIQ